MLFEFIQENAVRRKSGIGETDLFQMLIDANLRSTGYSIIIIHKRMASSLI